MVIMALDHVRDFFHSEAQKFQPDDLARTTAALFFTRWITHFCAPVFMFAAGASAFLWWYYKGRSQRELSMYLWKRGLWLVFLELTLLRFEFNFSLTEGPVLLTVLWALGWSMVVLGFTSRLPMRWLAILSIATIVLHNLFDGRGWAVLHRPGAIPIHGVVVIVGYPLIPWVAVMSAGFCLGRVLVMDPMARGRWLVRLGAGLTAAFLLIRSLNVYGDPQPWKTLGVLSFLRCTKYPPSLDFLLMTLGPALLMLAWFYRLRLAASNPLAVVGRVPLFYFLAHFFLAHVLTIPYALLLYGRAAFLLHPFSPEGFPRDYGYSLGVVYLTWILVVLLMYPACVWFGRLKQESRSPLLAYL